MKHAKSLIPTIVLLSVMCGSVLAEPYQGNSGSEGRRGPPAITDVQHLLGHASVKTTERAYAAFIRNERFMKTIELLDQPNQPTLKGVT